jgi:hypothetical protein
LAPRGASTAKTAPATVFLISSPVRADDPARDSAAANTKRRPRTRHNMPAPLRANTDPYGSDYWEGVWQGSPFFAEPVNWAGRRPCNSGQDAGRVITKGLGLGVAQHSPQLGRRRLDRCCSHRRSGTRPDRKNWPPQRGYRSPAPETALQPDRNDGPGDGRYATSLLRPSLKRCSVSGFSRNPSG